MKKSKRVPATMVLAVASLVLAGCSNETRQVRRCVDEKGNLLPESACGGGYYAGRGYGYPRWVYGGETDGRTVRNYATAPAPGAHVVTPAGKTITRGGFGSSGRGGGFGFGG